MPKTKTQTKTKAGPIEESVRIRMSGGYKAWLEELAEHCQTNVAGLVAVAVLGHAKTTGFEKKPPRRVS